MDTGKLKAIRAEIEEAGAGIAEKQGEGKEAARWGRVNLASAAVDGKEKEKQAKLEKLLYDRQHYFDEGFRVEKTPEELYREIIEEIDRIIDEELKG